MEQNPITFTANDFSVPPKANCTCPDYWFPADRREELRKLNHGQDGALTHHQDCGKTTKGML